MSATFRKPGSPTDSTTARHVSFVRKSLVSGKDGPTKMCDGMDGTSYTVMLVEVETDMSWMTPNVLSPVQLADTGRLEKESLLVSLADESHQDFKRITAEVLKGVAAIIDAKHLHDLMAPKAYGGTNV